MSMLGVGSGKGAGYYLQGDQYSGSGGKRVDGE